MADSSGQADLSGIDINKLAVGFADEASIFKNFLIKATTKAREMRWYQKTSGFLDSTDTTGITDSQISNVASLALPDVVEQSWTRITSYVRKYFVESPWISIEDIKDSDPDIIATNVRDLTNAVDNQVDIRIYSYLSGSAILSGSATGAGWNDGTNGNPFLDLLSGSMAIRKRGYDISNVVAWMSPEAYKYLVNYIVSVKGSQIPGFSSGKAESGVLTKIAGNKIVVSENCDETNVVQMIPNKTAKWKSFMPMTARTKVEEGIGVKIRIWEEGEILLEQPYALHLIKEVIQ